MDWIMVDDEIFDFVGKFTVEADTALYGRKTYEMMENYWPTAADKPNATKHDIEHSQWYNNVNKVVLSRTLKSKGSNKTKFISDNISNNKWIKTSGRKEYFNFWKPDSCPFINGIQSH